MLNITFFRIRNSTAKLKKVSIEWDMVKRSTHSLLSLSLSPGLLKHFNWGWRSKASKTSPNSSIFFGSFSILWIIWWMIMDGKMFLVEIKGCCRVCQKIPAVFHYFSHKLNIFLNLFNEFYFRKCVSKFVNIFACDWFYVTIFCTSIESLSRFLF